MTDILSHPLLQQAYDVCQAIEKCGASPRLTDAVGQAADLMHAIDAHLHAAPVAPASPKVEAIQGQAISFMLDPLEQAIESTVRLMREESEIALPSIMRLGESRVNQVSMSTECSQPSTSVGSRLGKHLDELLAAQLKRVSADEKV